MRQHPDDRYWRAETFEEHMHPDIHWIEDPAFADAFHTLIEDTTMRTEAAYTQPEGVLPGFINIQRAPDGGYAVKVRTPQTTQAAFILIPEEDWQQLIADAAMLRPSADHPDAPLPEPEPVEIEPAVKHTDTDIIELTPEMEQALVDEAPEVPEHGAVAGDPLGQRSADTGVTSLSRDPLADRHTD